MGEAWEPSKRREKKPEEKRHHDEQQSVFNTVTTMMGYSMLFVFGYLRDFFALLTGRSRYISELYVSFDFVIG